MALEFQTQPIGTLAVNGVNLHLVGTTHQGRVSRWFVPVVPNQDPVEGVHVSFTDLPPQHHIGDIHPGMNPDRLLATRVMLNQDPTLQRLVDRWEGQIQAPFPTRGWFMVLAGHIPAQELTKLGIRPEDLRRPGFLETISARWLDHRNITPNRIHGAVTVTDQQFYANFARTFLAPLTHAAIHRLTDLP